jgi:hypothetical protein
MFCHQCGSPSSGVANFCTGCGAQLDPPADSTTVLQVVVELDQPDPLEARPARTEQPTLVVQRGPNQGSRFVLARGVTTIGRDGGARILLNDISVSRRHATIERDGDHCLITDQGSLNGTYLNGQRIASSCRLTHGDTLQIGMFRIAFLEPGTNGSGTAPARPDR